jgi:hypothetical protein
MQGPSSPAASVPPVAQAPCSVIHVYSRRRKKKPREHYPKATGKETAGILHSPVQYSACEEQSRRFVYRDMTHLAEPYAKTWDGS